MKPAVVVLGGGFAGAWAARGLGNRAEVTLISDGNFLLFTPMLAEVAAADLDPRHIVTPLRQLCPTATVVQGRVIGIEIGERAVEVELPLGRGTRRMAGDTLVLAPGSVPATFGVPGVAEHALSFKDIADALRIRNRLLAALETAAVTGEARLTRLAVVGAGFSGAELTAALSDYLGTVARRFYPTAPSPEVVLVDAVERVTPALSPRLSRIAERGLRRRGVELVLGRAVAEVRPDGLTLEDGTTLEADTVIWAAGVRPGPLVEGSGLPTGTGGRWVVDGTLRAAPGVWAAGDAAAVPDGRGGICPPTAQHALRQGRYLGRHLPALLTGERAPPFRYRTMGELVSLGHRNAVGTVMGLGVSGFFAWWLWRSYYLWQLPTALRKARVALDWTLDLLFPPDIAGLPSSDLGPLPPR